jgi:hypothetical protein
MNKQRQGKASKPSQAKARQGKQSRSFLGMYEGLDEELGEGFPKPADPDLMEKSKLMMECMKDLMKSLGMAFQSQQIRI